MLGTLTIVSSDEGVSILVLKLPIDVLLCLLYGDVHVTIQTGQDTCRHANKQTNKHVSRIGLKSMEI